jgi:hypothetical protein
LAWRGVTFSSSFLARHMYICISQSTPTLVTRLQSKIAARVLFCPTGSCYWKQILVLWFTYSTDDGGKLGVKRPSSAGLHSGASQKTTIFVYGFWFDFYCCA